MENNRAISHQPPLDAKFGLHCGYFGTLPTLREYLQSKTLPRDSAQTFFILDIQHELDLLRDIPDAQLSISVPTVGFTDPIKDYSLAPLFAVPFSINGFVANQENPGLSRAKVFALDLANHSYAMLTSSQGNIEAPKTPGFFTSLQEITYVYSRAQCINGQGLQSSSHVKTNGNIELLTPRTGNAFTINLKVKSASTPQLLSERSVQYQPQVKDVPQGQLIALWQEEMHSGLLHIHYKMTKTSMLRHCYRAKVVFDLPLQEGIEYTWENAPITVGENAKSLRFTQYIGLSLDAFKDVITRIIPKGNPKLATTLYNHLIESILNRSLPLYALTPYFAQADQIRAALMQIDMMKYDKHDNYVFKKIFQLLGNHTKTEFDFVDEVDRLLSFGPEYLESSIMIQTKGKAVQNQERMIEATIVVEKGPQEVIHAQSSKTPLQIINKSPSIKKPTEVKETPGKRVSRGAVYQLNLPSILKGANVIEGFKENDKINLSSLLDSLGKTSGGSSVVHAQITSSGDTEIWVEHFDKSNEAQHYHVATLKGVGHLPGDISSFIEYGR